MSPLEDRLPKQGSPPHTKDSYESLFLSLPFAAFIASRQAELFDCNAAACELFSESKANLLQRPVTALFGFNSPLSFNQVIHQLENKPQVSVPVTVRRTGGTHIPGKATFLNLNNARLGIVLPVNETGSEMPASGPAALNGKTLLRVSSVAVSSGDLKTRLQTIVDQVAEVLRADRVSLITCDIEKGLILETLKSGPGAGEITSISFEEFTDGLSGWALRTRQPARSSKLEPDERESRPVQEQRRKTNAGSILVVPVQYREHVLGTLTAINRPDQPDFTSQDQDLLAAIASQAAIAIVNARLIETERRLRVQAEILREVSGILNSSLDLGQVLELILEQLARVLEFESASIMLRGNGDLTIVSQRGFRDPDQFFTALQLNALQHVQQVIQNKQPLIINDTHQDPRWQKLINNEYIAAWMGVPLIARGEAIGLLNLDRTQRNTFHGADTDLALAFANQAAVAIDNARLFETTQRRAEEADALRATMADILAELELPRLLHAILERAITLLRASGGDLGLYLDKEANLKIVSSINLGQDYSGTKMSLGEGLMGRVAQSLEPLIIDDYETWQGRSRQYQPGLCRAAIGVPMLIGDRLVGVIGIVEQDSRRKFTSSDLTLLSLFAQQAAVAVENARLYQAACEAADRRTALHHISQEIVSITRTPEQIYRTIHQAAARLVPCNAFVISLYQREQEQIQPAYLIDLGQRQPGSAIPASEGLSGYVLKNGTSVYIPNLEVHQREKKGLSFDPVHFGTHSKVQSVLAVPMRMGDEILGILSVQSYQANAYSDEDLDLLEMLASYAAIALQNARLFEEVQYLAITDPLTRITNRRQLFELAQREFSRAQRFGNQLSLLMVDVDEFKLVNDKYGHPAGDQVLVGLTQRLSQNLREIDVFGRYGGEEFLIVLPEASHAGAYQAAERLRQLVASTPFHTDSGPISITISLGVATLQPQVENLGQLIKLADQAAYTAKMAGRNRVSAAGSYG